MLVLYVFWGVDFIKVDDLGFWDGDGLILFYWVDEVEVFSFVVVNCGRDIVFSLFLGVVYIGDVFYLCWYVYLWWILCDFWDDWEVLKW